MSIYNWLASGRSVQENFTATRQLMCAPNCKVLSIQPPSRSAMHSHLRISSATAPLISTICSIWTARRFVRSEEHTSELQSLMRISYAVFCLKKKKNPNVTHTTHTTHHVVKTI